MQRTMNRDEKRPKWWYEETDPVGVDYSSAELVQRYDDRHQKLRDYEKNSEIIMNDTILDAKNLTKRFDTKIVLDTISFDVKKGEIFGLLGPNGAGKTTMIRIILDIIKADNGSVNIFGDIFNERLKERIGYLPEERGLYQKTTIFECLKYFAELKSVKKSETAIDFWLNKVELYEYKYKRVEELSKGMQQKIQLVAAFIHNPELLILDEPFAGLDPVNTKLIKDILLDLKRVGKTIILSTHQMDQVERMCDRILMVNRGKRVLYGSLAEIKSNYKETVVVEYEGDLKQVEGIKKIEDYGNYAELCLDVDTDPQEVLKKLMAVVGVRRFELKAPSLNEIFIEVVENA